MGTSLEEIGVLGREMLRQISDEIVDPSLCVDFLRFSIRLLIPLYSKMAKTLYPTL